MDIHNWSDVDVTSPVTQEINVIISNNIFKLVVSNEYRVFSFNKREHVWSRVWITNTTATVSTNLCGDGKCHNFLGHDRSD